jgi:diguanylate cyclase (GGDEF)-like protein
MRTLLSILLVAGILGATGVVAVVLRDNAVAGARDAEQDNARKVSQELVKTLQATAFTLRGVVGLFDASAEVKAPEFHAFVHPLFHEQSALNAILWMPRIADRERGAYERANHPITEGPPTARQRAAKRAVYFPVTYFESQSSRHAPGFDGASDPLRRAAMLRAIQRSQPQATTPVALASSGKAGIVIYQPVFASHRVPGTRAERELTVQGIVAGSYRIDSLFASLRRSVPAGTKLQVRQDGKRISGPRRMDDGENSQVTVAGRTWTVRASSNLSPSLAAPAAILLAGAALALLVALMLRQSFTREAYALTMVDTRMSERDAAQSELEAARVTAQELAAEQAALRRVATSVAAEAPLDTIFDTILSELVRLFGAEDAAVVQHVDGRLISSREPDWLTEGTDASVVRCEIRIGRSARGTVALLNPRPGREGTVELLRDFGELASVAVANSEARQELAVRASTDGLTGLLNRRTFDERLAGEVSRAVRHGRSLALAIIDIDHFKRVNDRRGHLAGDGVLTDVAAQLNNLARGGDTVARIGGEEFAWIMPETMFPVAFDVADRVRAAIAATDYEDAAGLTISVGIAELGDAVTGDALYARADTALFHAKRAGRNRTVRHEPAQLSATSGDA